MPKMSGSAFGPGSSRRTIRSGAAKAPSSTVVRLWVARMPIVSQSSRMRMSGSSRSTNPYTIFGASADAVSSPIVPSRVHAGESEVKILRPE